MQRIIAVLLVFAGLINIYPAVGVMSAQTLSDLYGIPAPQDDLLILLRHRAVLFGILGGLMIMSAFRKHLQPAAIIAGLVSMLAFVVLAVMAGDYGVSLRKVVIADVIASAGLIVAMLLLLKSRRSR